MAECHQHYRFIGGDILQTRRDQRRFCQAAAIACFATNSPAIAQRRNQNDGLKRRD